MSDCMVMFYGIPIWDKLWVIWDPNILPLKEKSKMLLFCLRFLICVFVFVFVFFFCPVFLVVVSLDFEHLIFGFISTVSFLSFLSSVLTDLHWRD